VALRAVERLDEDPLRDAAAEGDPRAVDLHKNRSAEDTRARDRDQISGMNPHLFEVVPEPSPPLNRDDSCLPVSLQMIECHGGPLKMIMILIFRIIVARLSRVKGTEAPAGLSPMSPRTVGLRASLGVEQGKGGCA